MKEKKNQIDHITVTYDRETFFPLEAFADAAAPGEESPGVCWAYHEKLSIDRETQTITHERKPFADCDITNTYHIAEGVSHLLDGLDADALSGAPELQAQPDPQDVRTWSIGLTLASGEQREAAGICDANALPEGLTALLTMVLRFYAFYGAGEMFGILEEKKK